MSAMNSRNAKVLSAGRSGGTLLGGVSSSARSLLTGESPYDVLEGKNKIAEQAIKNAEAELKPLKDQNALRKTMMDRAASKAVDSEYTSGSYGGITGNYRDYHSAYVAAKSGVGVTHDASGDWFEFNGQRVDMARADSIDIGLKDANANNYYEQAVSGTLHGGDTTITDARDTLVHQHGVTVEGILGDLKKSYGNTNTKINEMSAEIATQSQKLNENRTGHKARRAESNANRFGGGGGKSGG